MWIIIYCKQGRCFPCHSRWYLSDFPPSIHISTWYVLKFNECSCEFWCFWELLPKEPCWPVYKLAPPNLTSQNLHFMLHQCNPLKFSKHSYAVYHCLGFGSLETAWDADSCASIYWGSAFRRNLEWNKGSTTGQGRRPGQDVGSAGPIGRFWSMNYTTKLSYPEVRGLAISVYYWWWTTFGKGSNLGISRQVLSHRLRTILRRMQLGALNNPSSEQLGDLLQSFQVFAYTIHSMKKQQPLLLCYCLKTCPNIVVFKPYLLHQIHLLKIQIADSHPQRFWVSHSGVEPNNE